MLYIDNTWLQKLQRELNISGHYDLAYFSRPYFQDKKLKQKLHEFYQQYTSYDTNSATPNANMLIEQGLIDIFTCLFTHENILNKKTDKIITSEPGTLNKHINVDHRGLKKAIEFIHAHACDDISLAQISQHSHLSRPHLIKLFSQTYGITPHAYQLSLRIDLAKKLLKEKDISETALQCGFNDQAHFQNTFKRMVATTPYQYKQLKHAG